MNNTKVVNRMEMAIQDAVVLGLERCERGQFEEEENVFFTRIL